jgi:hypothetical protein
MKTPSGATYDPRRYYFDNGDLFASDGKTWALRGRFETGYGAFSSSSGASAYLRIDIRYSRLRRDHTVVSPAQCCHSDKVLQPFGVLQKAVQNLTMVWLRRPRPTVAQVSMFPSCSNAATWPALHQMPS